MRNSSLKSIAKLVANQGQASFLRDLFDFLSSMVEFDRAVVAIHSSNSFPEILSWRDRNTNAVSVDNVVGSDTWHQSPLAEFVDSGGNGTFQLWDHVPVDTRERKTFLRHLQQRDTGDQFAVVSSLEKEKSLVLWLERSRSRSRYQSEEIRQLEAAADLIKSLLQQHWQRFGWHEGVDRSTAGFAIHSQLAHLLNNSDLTPRESRVLKSILLGQPNKLIGRQLGISDQTVKIYCRNIYAKLGLGGRTQIYTSLIRSIVQDQVFPGP
jgi:DNA-binding CsgD family transcriptional regulator